MPESAKTPPECKNRCSVCGCDLPTQPAGDGSCSACGHRIWFRKRDANGLITVDLMPSMNPDQAPIDRLGELFVSGSRAPRVLLNFRHIDFVTSTFINRLLVLRRTIQDARGRLLLCGLNPVIQEIFEINRLGNLFDVFSNEQDAIGE
jgi:anti-sigma B factor antagonist